MSLKKLEIFDCGDITFEWKKGGKSVLRIREFLTEVDSIMIPQLSNRVDINDYSQKLAENADNLFAVYHMKDIANCAVYCNREVAYISSIAVKEKYQNRGIGNLMMLEIKKHVRDKNICSIRLKVHKGNDTAISYYVKNGFKKIDQENDWIDMEMMV